MSAKIYCVLLRHMYVAPHFQGSVPSACSLSRSSLAQTELSDRVASTTHKIARPNIYENEIFHSTAERALGFMKNYFLYSARESANFTKAMTDTVCKELEAFMTQQVVKSCRSGSRRLRRLTRCVLFLLGSPCSRVATWSTSCVCSKYRKKWEPGSRDSPRFVVGRIRRGLVFARN